MEKERVEELLKEQIDLLDQSVATLEKSVEKCRGIIGKETFSFEEMESFDSLSSKFGRTSDLYTQKVLRTVWMLLHEPFCPFIDLLNKAEKLGVIKNSDQIIEIRDVRNQIAHEYISEAIQKIIPEVIELCADLITNINKTKQFIAHRR